MDLAARREALAQLHAVVDACRRCPIGSTRTKVVCGVGDPMARLAIVGEGPGESEDRQGEPFVGRAGELLTRMLAAIGLRRDDVFVTNTIKCRAIQVTGDRVANRAPMQEEMANCREYLDRELEVIRPRIILALGAPAAKSFLGPGFSITRQRGVWYPGPFGAEIMATYHPAYILRLTGGNITAVKKLVWSDLQAVRAKLDAIDSAGPSGPENGAPDRRASGATSTSAESTTTEPIELKLDLS